MVRLHGLVTLGAALVFMTTALIQGCGLKADPAPRRIQPFKPVTEFRLQEETRGISEYNAMRSWASKGTDVFLKSSMESMKDE